MTRKLRIKSPTTPAGEDPMVTISNQEKQIDMLLKRIEQLMLQVDTYASDCRKAESALGTANDQIASLQVKISDMRAVATRMMGWQDAALTFFDRTNRK
jgi:chromosome segregation ATPase